MRKAPSCGKEDKLHFLGSWEKDLCYFGRGNGGEDELMASDGDISLSGREKEVLTLLACGESNQTIAKKLHLSPETVRNYTRLARLKLGARSRSHAIAIAALDGHLDKEQVLSAVDRKNP